MVLRQRGRPGDGAHNPGHKGHLLAATAGANGRGGGAPSVTRIDPRRLGELLVDRGLLTASRLEEVVLQQPASGKRLGALLVELGAVHERDVVTAVAEQFGLPTVDLRQEVPTAEAVKLVPEPLARDLTAVPLRRADGEVVVAVADPLDQRTVSLLARAVAGPIRLVMAPAGDIRRAIGNSYRALGGVERLIEAFQAENTKRPAAAQKGHEVDADAPIIRMVNLIITQALRDRTSDIHIEPQDGRLRVRYRIDGALHDVLALPDNVGPALVSRLKIMAGINIVERRRPMDGQIVTEVDGRPLDIRLNTTPTIWGEKAVLRLLDRSRTLLELDELGMPSGTHATFSKLMRAPFGMVVCGGPTGSGKTTTLYASLTEVNQIERNITTIEDPVEYVFPSINQIQINEQAGLGFASGLRAILRQDPDVILVGEVRDAETARLAVQSALSGHLVLSSIHATDAVSALHRFVDMGIEAFLVASSVSMVVSQRLVRRICPQCRVAYQPNAEEKAFYRAAGGKQKRQFWQGEGCNFCSRTGYQERVGVYELLEVTEEIKGLLVDNAAHDEMQKMAVSKGMRTLLDEGIDLVAHDVTTIAEIMRTIYTAV